MSLTVEAGRIFRVAASFVSGDLRILANQPAADFLAVLVMAHHQLIGSLAGLLPLLDQGQSIDVEILGPIGTDAVIHAGDHEEAHGFSSGLRSGLGDHILVVIDSHVGWNAAVIPPADEQELAASSEVLAQVRIHRVDGRDLGTIRQRDIAIPIQAASL